MNCLKLKLSENQKNNLIKILGDSLIEIRETEKGLNILNELIKKTSNEKEKINLLSILIKGYLDLSEFTKVVDICKQINENKISEPIDRGKSFNILGLVEIFRENNLVNALNYFSDAEKHFKDANSKFDVAVMQMNIGNIHNMKNEYDLAEEYWNKSLQTNYSVGNLEHEAQIRSNLGIYNFRKLIFEKSIEDYKQALNIFLALGNNLRKAIVLVNLFEVNMVICEYTTAINSLVEAQSIFSEIKNNVEEVESIFLLSESYYLLGSYDDFQLYLEKFSKKLKNNSMNGKHEIYKKYLFSLKSIIDNKYEKAINLLNELRHEFLNLEDPYHYFRSTLFLINSLIINKNYNRAFEILNEKNFKNICADNYLFESEYYYTIGLFAETSNIFKLKHPSVYFENSFELIKDKTITELTWKILLKYTEGYLKRGDIKKAKYFALYGIELIKFIANKIKNEKLKYIYLNHPERNKALKVFNSIEKGLLH